MTHIRKIGLVDVTDEGLLVVLKHGGRTWILPGGKPEIGEDDETALLREIDEELSCGVTGLKPLTTIRSVAADRPADTVEVRCYLGSLNAEPSRAAEIAGVRRVPIDDPEVPLAPSIVDGLLPILRERAARGFRVYERSILEGGTKARIDFGILSRDDGLDDVELSITWETLGSFEIMRISLFDDALDVMTRMPDLFEALSQARKDHRADGRRTTLTKDQVVAILLECGFSDQTPEPEPNHGSPLFSVQMGYGRIVHNATAAWAALDWCRKAKMPFGTMLRVLSSAADADMPLEAEQTAIATFEFHDEGTAPIERDILGKVVERK